MTALLSRVGVLLPHLLALAVAIWLVSSRFLNGHLADVSNGFQWMAITYLALPAAIWSLIFSVVSLLSAPARTRRMAALPLAITLVGLALYAVPTSLVETVDYERHRDARADVVRRIDSGELWNGSSYIQVVSLPQTGYAKSVSNGADQDCVGVYRENGALNVVFYPVAGGLLDRNRSIIYRSDWQPPTLPDKHLTNAAAVEPISAGWFWLSYSDQEQILPAAVIVGYLTAVSSVVAVPLLLIVRYLGRRIARLA